MFLKNPWRGMKMLLTIDTSSFVKELENLGVEKKTLVFIKAFLFDYMGADTIGPVAPPAPTPTPTAKIEITEVPVEPPAWQAAIPKSPLAKKLSSLVVSGNLAEYK